jgi:uncharacterized lipoprotein YajG
MKSIALLLAVLSLAACATPSKELPMVPSDAQMVPMNPDKYPFNSNDLTTPPTGAAVSLTAR